MEAELIQLAQEAVTALQTGPPPNWAEIMTARAAVAGVVVQAILIGGGLLLMNKSSNARNRQLDQQDTALRQQGEALRQQAKS